MTDSMTSAKSGDSTAKETDADIVEVKTLTHQQTGKQHIANYIVPLPNGKTAIHCYCSFTQQTEPITEEIDLDADNMCRMCAAGYRKNIRGDKNDN